MNKNYQIIIVIKLIAILLIMPFKVLLISEHSGLLSQTILTIDQYLEQAEDAYYDGDFDNSLEYIRLCLKEYKINDEQRIKAYTILTRTFIAMDQTEKAKEYIKKILEIEPDYLPTLEEETPNYVNTVLLVKNEMAKQTKTTEESGINSWFWIGAGGLVATAAIIVIASTGENKKDNNGEPLPEPPEFP